MLGVFDSGVGGMSILQSIHKAMPEVSTIYFGDHAHVPYGNRSHEEITEFTWNAVQWLFNEGCELIILACNTASAQALRTIQQEYLPHDSKKRVLGIIRPTAEWIANQQSDYIALLCTPATHTSQAYLHECEKLQVQKTIVTHPCHAWTGLIEAGKAQDASTGEEVHADIAELYATIQPDQLVLACTHYPAVKHWVEQFADCPVIDQGPIVAKSLLDYLIRHTEIANRLDMSGARRYVTTGSSDLANAAAEAIFDASVVFEEIGPATG